MLVSKRLSRIKDKLLCIFEDGTISIESVVSLEGDILETENRCVNVSDLDCFVNVDGSILYATNFNFNARSESENLLKLRRSAVISNIFNFDKQKKLDIMSYLPWIALIIVVMFLS